MKGKPDSALALWNGWILDRKSAKAGEMQVKDKPVAVPLPGPDGDEMGMEGLVFPCFAERQRQDPTSSGFLPYGVRSCAFEEMLDQTLNGVLGLQSGQS